MLTPPLYPIFLDLAGKTAVVAGGGKVGLRKTRGLLEAGARVRVVSPVFDPEFDELIVETVTREYRPSDLDGAFLVFAATGSRDVNRAIGEDARARGILANIADAPGECAFIVPARVNTEDLQIAISTGGADPSRAAQTRRRVEAALRAMQ